MARFGKKDFDVMNPEERNPNAKKATQQLGKMVKKLAKTIGKLVRKFVELLIELGPVGWIILIVLLVIIIIVAFFKMPGMMQNKLLSVFSFENFLELQSKNALNNQDIEDVANYLEEMGYSLIGDGFVIPNLNNSTTYKTNEEIQRGIKDGDLNYENWEYKLDSEIDSTIDLSIAKYHYYKKIDENNYELISNFEYYNSLGQLIDNETGDLCSKNDTYIDEFGIIRNSKDINKNGIGKVKLVDESKIKNYRRIRSYLLSNYRIYTLKNWDETWLQEIGAWIRKYTGGNQDAWAKGLIKLYVTMKDEDTIDESIKYTNPEAYDLLIKYYKDPRYAQRHWGWWDADGLVPGFRDVAKIEENKLILRKGLNNNAMVFQLEGFAPRYGMSLEFLLSLHLGTGAPDLATAMLQSFDTEMQLYMR